MCNQQAFFECKNFSQAKWLFKHAIQFNEKSDNESESEDESGSDVFVVSVDQQQERDGNVVGKEVFRHAVVTTKSKWLDSVIAEKGLLPGAITPCKAHYWYAHALASASKNPNLVVYDMELRGEIQKHLLEVLQCANTDTDTDSDNSSISTQMLDYARVQLKEINFMIEHVDGELEDP